MPAKKPAPKSAKGKKAASRPPVKKAVMARKLPAERIKAAAATERKTAAAPKKAAPHSIPTNTTDETIEMRKAAQAAPPEAVPSEASSAPSENEILIPARASAPATAPTSGVDNDDSEAIEPGSLLAGPRNVQPYIVKRGEQYMSKEQLEHFRQILNSWKRDLMVEVDRTVSHMKDEAANFPDPNDRATQEEEFSL